MTTAAGPQAEGRPPFYVRLPVKLLKTVLRIARRAGMAIAALAAFGAALFALDAALLGESRRRR